MRLRHGKPLGVPYGALLAVSCTNVRGPYPLFTLIVTPTGAVPPKDMKLETEFFNFSLTAISKYGHNKLSKAIANGLNDAVGVLKILSNDGCAVSVELVHTYFQYEREPMRPPIHDYFRKAKK